MNISIPAFLKGKMVAMTLCCLIAFGFLFAGANHIVYEVLGDGHYHYLFLVSLFEDGDLDFSNQYERYGDPYGAAIANPFPPGSAILWAPFYLFTRLVFLISGDPSIDPFAFAFQSRVMIGTVVLALLLAAMTFFYLRQRYGAVWAALGVAGAALATPFFHYAVIEPSYAHVPSAFCITLFFYFALKDPPRPLLLGGIAGLATLTKFPNGLLFPIFGLALLLKDRTLKRPLLFGLAGAVTISPLLLYWKWAYGHAFLIPQGSSYMTTHFPGIFNSIFSSRHGALTWSPILWLSIIGLVVLSFRRDLFLRCALIFFLGSIIVSGLPSDWWAGSALGARRWVDLTFFSAFGLAEILHRFSRLAIRSPQKVAITLASVLVGTLIVVQLTMDRLYVRGRIPHNQVVTFPELYEPVMEDLYRRVGNPFSFPASAVFALRHGVPLSVYDRFVGKILNRDFNSDGPGLDPWLPEQKIYFIKGFSFRNEPRLQGKNAKIFLPLAHRAELSLTLLLDGSSNPPPLDLSWNGTSVARILEYGWNDPIRFRVPESIVHFGTNVLTISKKTSSVTLIPGPLTVAPFTGEFISVLPLGYVDSITPGPGGVGITVQGWALGRRGPVEVRALNYPGRHAVKAQWRGCRDDLRSVHPDMVGFEQAGFSLYLRGAGESLSSRTVVLEIEEEGGKSNLLIRTVAVTNPVDAGNSEP
ncbi:MAG TPA: hypothetical protein PK014_04800 [Thermoanaerobaculia bacterium]|nr:hypothetical protein [Thermoanaerobaculia bacterium]HUM29532.1 hypothetical protein [Thermoanaerobaculia bacterium]HXK67915.1 hypothetical protein [Thermoanaerobaculia bacterium]